jgi:hypothetical protein
MMGKSLEDFLISAKNHHIAWLSINFLALAVLVVSHRPDAVIHPQFWAEDGHVFYHDAYENGFVSLIYPLGGYLNTFSRIVALLAVQFPLNLGPLIFVFFAFLVQMFPPMLVLSNWMDVAIPSIPMQVALAYFYVLMPNCWEINLNLTDAQWHLAIVSFLIIALTRREWSRMIWIDAAILLISGLSGPFSIFLFPISVFDYVNTRSRKHLIYASVLTSAALIQILFIIFSSTTARGSEPLGISGYRFCEILINQIMLGGMLGNLLMSVIIVEITPYWQFCCLLLALFFLTVLGIVLKSSPGIFRRGVVFATLLFLAALKSPYLLVPGHKWLIMTLPGHGMRYYIIPSLVWFATILLCVSSKSKVLRSTGSLLIFACVVGSYFEWEYPRYRMTNFTALAENFAKLPAGETMMFPENPSYGNSLDYWGMVLTKK